MSFAKFRAQIGRFGAMCAILLFLAGWLPGCAKPAPTSEPVTIRFAYPTESGLVPAMDYEALAEEWLMRELEEVASGLNELLWFRALDNVRQGVLIEMAYNLGMAGLMGFRNMIAAIQEGNWVEAKIQGLDSKWHRQVGKRAQTLMKRMETDAAP